MDNGSFGRRWSRIIGSDPRSEIDDELAFHLEQRVRDYEARGMDPEAAQAAARDRLGELKEVRRECTQLLSAERRSEARREWLKVSWLDFKLGFRMLVKYPGLTLVGGLAIAFAIWVGAGAFEFVTQVVHPNLPLPQGDRIVGIRNWDAAAGRAEQQLLYDFALWQDEVKSVEDLGAFRTTQRNLIAPGIATRPVEVAEITASAFRVARIPPLLGRALVTEDEQKGAPPVAVIGYDVWQSRFEGAADIVGREIRLGNTVHTVVGVMPEGFAFPVNHSLWTPLQADPSAYERRQGPGIRIFGRLAPGASLEEAQAELTGLGRRTAADFPDTHQHLRPQVLPYAKSIVDVSGLRSVGLMSINLFLVMLLVLVCANVALLMFARAAARENEIVVRNALGASRGRIITQLFAEALVLAGAGALVGLAAAGFGLRWGFSIVQTQFMQGGRLPFWFHASLSPMTVLYAGLLTLLGATIAGVVPALKVTRGLGTRLRQATAGGGGFRFGGIWTAVIIAQVAVTVAFPVTAFFTQRDAAQIEAVDVGFPAEEFLSVRLEMDREPGPGAPADTSQAEFLARFKATVQKLEERLTADPTVVAVTFAEHLPRMYHPHRRVEVDEGGAAPPDPKFPGPGYRVSSVSVAPDFFDVLNAPILAGRGFHSGDIQPNARAVIVNQSFVDRVLGGRNPIGRQLRYRYFEGQDRSRSMDDEPWYEIVGVVRDMGMSAGEFDPKIAGFYHPIAPGGASPLHMAVHVKGDPKSLAPRLRSLAAAVDPALRLHEIQALDEVTQAELQFIDFWFWLTMVLSSVALLLSLAGIYSVMAFTVSQRTREIGIRVALGASARRVVTAIFRRPLTQVGLGIVAGAFLTGAFLLAFYGGALSASQVGLLVGYAALMMAVCMLACIVPTRRALRIEPTEALKADA